MKEKIERSEAPRFVLMKTTKASAAAATASAATEATTFSMVVGASSSSSSGSSSSTSLSLRVCVLNPFCAQFVCIAHPEDKLKVACLALQTFLLQPRFHQPASLPRTQDAETWSTEDGQIFPPTPPATPPTTSSDSGYPCDFCPKVYPSKSKLAEHINFRHSEARPHQCSHCSKVFKSNSNLKQHIRCAHERPRFPCPDCPNNSAKVFSESGLRYHRLTAHSGAAQSQRHPCQICGRTFLQATLLRKHMTSAHVGERKFSCPYCPATFKRKDHADRHITDTHSLVSELFECEDCGGRFQSASRLKQHAKLHHDENVRKPCQFCGKKMLVKNLMTHFQRVHHSQVDKLLCLKHHQHQTATVIKKLNLNDSSYC